MNPVDQVDLPLPAARRPPPVACERRRRRHRRPRTGPARPGRRGGPGPVRPGYACRVLFIGQAFLYKAITFGFAAIRTAFFDVPSGDTGSCFAVIAIGSFFGPLLLGKLFDTVGRRVMISSTYLLSGVLLFGTAWLFD